MKNFSNYISSTNRNNLRLFISVSIIALIAITGVLVWQTTAQMQTAEQFSANGVPTPTPLNLTVTRNDDRNVVCVTDDCSLREAITAATASSGNDTINFASNLTTINLAGSLFINSTGTLAINGLGANVLTINGNGNRIFFTTDATVSISRLTLTGGTGTGAAIYTLRGSLTLDYVNITGNQAQIDHNGGGVYYNGGVHKISNSTFSANTAYQGGGIFNNGGTLTVINTTISGNTANTNGGGAVPGDATLRNVTITNNTAAFGGGISTFAGILNFGNTIVAANTSTTNTGPEISTTNIVVSSGGNLIGDSPGDSANVRNRITTGVPINYQSTDIRDVNPLLGILQNNGGTTPTFALLAGSPAIDTGLNTLAVDPSNGNTPLIFDQRGTGFPRTVDGNSDNTATVDIGAFEVQATPTPTPTNVCTPSTTVTEGDLFPGGIVSFGVTSGAGSVTVDHVNAGTGLQSLTVVSSTNAVVNIPPFTPGTQMPVVITFTPINPGLAVDFTLRAASTFHAANIRARCAEVCTPSTTVTEGDLFPGGIVSFGISSGPGSVTVDHVNAGTGLQSLTVIGTPVNAVVNIPVFTIGTTMPVIVTFTPINPTQPVDFTLRAASSFHAANIRVRCSVTNKPDVSVRSAEKPVRLTSSITKFIQ